MQDLVKTKSIRKAIKSNYDVKNDKNASILGSTMMRKPRIQYALLDLMDKTGVGDAALVERLKKMIFDAKKQVIDHDGNIRELDDNMASLKGLDMAFKIKGAYAPERHEISSVSVNLYQDLTDDELDRRLQLIAAREAIIAGGAGTQTRS